MKQLLLAAVATLAIVSSAAAEDRRVKSFDCYDRETFYNLYDRRNKTVLSETKLPLPIKDLDKGAGPWDEIVLTYYKEKEYMGGYSWTLVIQRPDVWEKRETIFCVFMAGSSYSENQLEKEMEALREKGHK